MILEESGIFWVPCTRRYVCLKNYGCCVDVTFLFAMWRQCYTFHAHRLHTRHIETRVTHSMHTTIAYVCLKRKRKIFEIWCIACCYGLMCGRQIISCAHSKKSVNAVVPNALSHLVFLNTVETRFKLFSVRLTTAATVTTCDAYLLTVAITTTVT